MRKKAVPIGFIQAWHTEFRQKSFEDHRLRLNIQILSTSIHTHNLNTQIGFTKVQMEFTKLSRAFEGRLTAKAPIGGNFG